MKTIYNNVLLKEIKTPESTIAVEPDLKTPIKATVVASPVRPPYLFAGGEIYFQPFAEGEIAWFFPRDAREIEIKKEKYYVIDENDILYFE